MELKFLGRGAAFNPNEGNTSAYFIEDDNLFLLDSGETVFASLIKNNILEKINNIYIMITHTHSDHIGSLGSIVHYFYYMKESNATIVLPTDAKYQKDIEELLRIFGCDKENYNFIKEIELDNNYKSFNKLRFLETKHSKNLDCYGLLFDTNNGYVYYSGDTLEVTNVTNLINNNEKIDKLYMDTTTTDYEGNVHLNIYILKDSIPDSVKNKVYCMHLNNNECIEEAKRIGFNVVESKVKENQY